MRQNKVRLIKRRGGDLPEYKQERKICVLVSWETWLPRIWNDGL